MDSPKKFRKPPANIVFNIDGAADRTNEAMIEALTASIRQRLEQGTLVIPRLPQAAGRILQITQSGDIALGEVTKVILTDPVLAARVLATANSAAFAGTARVESLNTAIVRIGLKTVCNIVFAESIQTTMFSSRSYRGIVEQSWRISMGCAVACDALARATGIEREGAFLLGLLHDTGTPVLISAVAELEQKNRASLGEDTVEILHERLHESLGAHVLRKWEMPDAMVEAASEHHRYRRQAATPAQRLIYAANLICQHLGVGSIQREVAFNVEHVMADLELTDAARLEPILQRVSAEASALLSGFGSNAPEAGSSPRPSGTMPRPSGLMPKPNDRAA